jgi:hypothetical protein
MRHALLACIGIVVLGIAWRVHELFVAGGALHAKEVAARELASRILRAEIGRRDAPPASARFAPYDFLDALVAEGRVSGLERVAGADRELWRTRDYVFLIRLLNKFKRPFARPPTDGRPEPGLGADFELWAWPADPRDVALAQFFGSDAGFLLQGDNGSFAGPEARPEEASLASPLQQFGNERGADRDWITLESVREP